MEINMSTMTLRPGEAADLHVTDTKDDGFFARLVKARESEARRRSAAYLAWFSDERLRGLGLSPRDVAAIRDGTFEGLSF
jgi:hypothetical protein